MSQAPSESQPHDPAVVRDAVRERYARAAVRVEEASGGASGLRLPDPARDLPLVDLTPATAGEDACCGPSECGPADGDAGCAPDQIGAVAAFYRQADTADLPASITDAALGCGDPTALAELERGETVLDLGSGGGIDCFLAAKLVGPEGRVIGVDMTDEMLALAARNRERVGAANVEFRKGQIEALPVEDASVDVVISNCVINLSTDKEAVLREAWRVLRPGGRFRVSDLVLTRALSREEARSMAEWTGCVAGALHRDAFADALAAAGFADMRLTLGAAWRDGVHSAQIGASKPG
ncbi:MAG: arsenite methyltransferase [Chloroflexota bacterium]|nr:arsenite methyltransferase [Chloroflexota bacterium]